MEIAPSEARFLQYRPSTPVVAGLTHQAANLVCLLREAQATARLGILPPLHLDARHNFGARREWRWEQYFDFDASSLTDAQGRHPLPIAGRPPEQAVRTLHLREGTPVPDRARDYPLVVRRISRPLFREVLPTDDWPAAKVELRTCARARNLARPVVRRLRALGDGRFVSVHVRRGDRVAAGDYPEWLTAPPHIRRCLQERGVADGAVVYIASDERDPEFWQPLKAAYRLFRYADFPALEALIAGADEAPDNYLLFQVEQEVLRQGRLRIGTKPNQSWADGWLIDQRHWPPRKPSGRLASGRRRMAALLRRLAG